MDKTIKVSPAKVKHIPWERSLQGKVCTSSWHCLFVNQTEKQITWPATEWSSRGAIKEQMWKLFSIEWENCYCGDCATVWVASNEEERRTHSCMCKDIEEQCVITCISYFLYNLLVCFQEIFWSSAYYSSDVEYKSCSAGNVFFIMFHF